MEYALPIIFMLVMGLALLIYVILDGYDLGVGLLLPLASDTEKDVMISSIGPFWDANETWIVLGVGVLLIAFPIAHGVVLTALYLPATLMLLGLILRGVAFELRVKAGADHKKRWDTIFFVGSFIAATCQGWMLGSYVTGLEPSILNGWFSALIAFAMPALYVMLGAAWLMMKTEGALLDKTVKWAKIAVIPMGVGLLLVSIATPLVSASIAEKWFTLPNAIGLFPIPLACVLAYGAIVWVLRHPSAITHGYAWLIFVALVLICALSGVGLAYSLFPSIVIGQLDIWEAAAATESLTIILVGVAITLPMIIGYSIFIYRIFHGKTRALSYE